MKHFKEGKICRDDEVIALEKFTPHFYPDRLDQPAKVKKPSVIFVVNMGDLFCDGVPSEWIVQTLEACNRAPQHIYLFLTKNPVRYTFYDEYYRPNYYWGYTEEGGKFTDRGIIKFLETGERLGWNMWLSCEPCFGSPYISSALKFVVIGAQTKPYKPVPLETVKEIVYDCKRAYKNVKKNHTLVFMKSNLDCEGLGIMRRRELPFGLRTK